MKRRAFIALLGGAAAAWPLAARAQQPAKLPTIGYLGTAAASAWAPWTAAFVQRLHELGWIEGRTVAIEYRWAEGRDERYREISSEFVGLKVAAILTQGTQAALAAKQATSTIPIVAVAVGDPVGSGLVASLARPGGNNRLVAPVARYREQTARIASRGGSRLAPSGHSASRGQSCEC